MAEIYHRRQHYYYNNYYDHYDTGNTSNKTHITTTNYHQDVSCFDRSAAICVACGIDCFYYSLLSVYPISLTLTHSLSLIIAMHRTATKSLSEPALACHRPPLESLFSYRHIELPHRISEQTITSIVQWLLILCYTPLGLLLVVIRSLVLIFVMVLIGMMLLVSRGKLFFFAPCLVRIFLPIFGFWVTTSGNHQLLRDGSWKYLAPPALPASLSLTSHSSPSLSHISRTSTTKPAATLAKRNKHAKTMSTTAVVMPCNHRTFVDVFPYLAILPVNVLIDKAFFSSSALANIFANMVCLISRSRFRR
jgi:hypothetical protein